MTVKRINIVSQLLLRPRMSMKFAWKSRTFSPSIRRLSDTKDRRTDFEKNRIFFKIHFLSLDDTEKMECFDAHARFVFYTLKLYEACGEASKVACHSLISFNVKSNKKRKSK